MTRPARIASLIVPLVLVSAISGDGAAAAVENNAYRQMLEASVAWDAAFNSENLDGVMALYADDAVSMPPGLPALVGKPSIQADYEFLFENFDFRHQTTVVQLEIHGAMAVERGEYTMLVVPADGSPAFVETGKHMIVRRSINGAWVVVMETWNTH